MDWILEHLQIVIFVVVGVLYFLQSIARQRGDDRADETSQPAAGQEDAAELERTKRIQEEIRRRILARQRGETPASRPAPASSFPRSVEPARPRPTPPPLVRREPPPIARPVESGIDTTMLERQRQLQERLAQARAAREAASRTGRATVPGEIGAARRSWRPATTNQRARELREQLTGTMSMRRAMLLREIIGPPLGMR